MVNLQPIDTPELCQRVSGQRLDFFASNTEIQQWLLNLPDDNTSYELLVVENVQRDNGWIQVATQTSLSEFTRLAEDEEDKKWNFWICSSSFTPYEMPSESRHLTALLSYSGCIHIQHGRQTKDPANSKQVCQDITSISIVDQVVHTESQGVRNYGEYLKLYRTLTNKIRKCLAYASILRFPGGIEREETKHGLWTEGAKLMYDNGYHFCHRPGNPLRK